MILKMLLFQRGFFMFLAAVLGITSDKKSKIRSDMPGSSDTKFIKPFLGKNTVRVIGVNQEIYSFKSKTTFAFFCSVEEI